MTRHFCLPTRYRNLAWYMVGAGAIATAAGFAVSPTNVWISLYVSALYFLWAALFGAFILAVATVSGAAWLTPYKVVAEAMTSFLIPGGIILVAVFFGGGNTLFEWTHAEAVAHHPALLEKQPYLNAPFFLFRMLSFIGIWTALSWQLVRMSRREQNYQARWSVLFLIAFAFTFSFASFDWLMTIEPHWYSTIYALYSFAGFFVAGFAILTIAVIGLDKFGFFNGVITENHYHDLGKFLFGFSTFWAYLWISQYLLIWYTNLPEETAYYTLRTQNDWDWLFYFNVLLNWVIPFFVLLPRQTKRNREVLLRVSIVLLVGRWFDLFLLVAPNVFHLSGIRGPSIGWIEVGGGLGLGGLFVLICASALGRHRLIPKSDPYFEEGAHLVQ